MKVLLAEDEAISCRALERDIKNWGYEVVSTNNGQEAWEVIKKDDIHLAILDWSMPGMNGVELCQKIRREYHEKKSKYIYVILLTGRDQQEDIIKGLSAGADDYITKPFNFLELKVRLRNGERIIELEDHRTKLAGYNDLTKLLNRKKINESLKEELERGYRESQPIGVIIAGIDHFKKITDSYGHFIGDSVFIEVASRLKNSIRPYDKIGRYGRDKIFVVLPNCYLLHMKQIADRLCHSVGEKKIKTDKALLDISISIGSASSDISLYASGDDLIQASERALYLAKKKGPNSIVVAESLHMTKK